MPQTPATSGGNTPVEVFRTHSSIEAEVVRGLLAAHDIGTGLGSAMSPQVFPVNFGHAVFRVSVPVNVAGRALELIS